MASGKDRLRSQLKKERPRSAHEAFFAQPDGQNHESSVLHDVVARTDSSDQTSSTSNTTAGVGVDLDVNTGSSLDTNTNSVSGTDSNSESIIGASANITSSSTSNIGANSTVSSKTEANLDVGSDPDITSSVVSGVGANPNTTFNSNSAFSRDIEVNPNINVNSEYSTSAGVASESGSDVSSISGSNVVSAVNENIFKCVDDPSVFAQQYIENYFKVLAQNLITVRNGRVTRIKKTDTYTHTTLYLDKNLEPRLNRYLRQSGLDKSPFINVAISFLLDHLGVK
ncbi:hypothetical protein C7445_12217 [Alicyclobacillus sacchari]|uniref:Uncharacterized protein n=1 Tax=Alicyclobacillus sacchari TaxID=392010 RepID=A0A4V3HDB0_9BACL|nr:hypothetical protein [Alicyclobacillus sacchari]TDY40354.1 hypothetical protein C7445_12217 [Alicyclobacillus sacchari]